MPTLRRHPLLITAVGAGLLAVVASASPYAGATAFAAPARAAVHAAVPDCAPGTHREPLLGAAGTGAFGDTSCSPDGVESYADLSRAGGTLASRQSAPYAAVAQGALSSAIAERQRLLAAGAVTAGQWRPLGVGPLDSAVAAYPRVAGLGLTKLSGRIEDLAVDPSDATHLLAATAGGGVWESTDSAAHWTSVGDALPTQVTGAVAFVPATRTAPEAIVVGTGDPAYGGSSNAGLGLFVSTDHGASWTHAAGAPTDGLTFVLRQRPGAPGIVWAGTSKGLYVSDDRGLSFTNAALPTTCTDLTSADCFFANMVTDVALQAGSDRVVAAVGWRAGQKPNAHGKPQSPRNGLYSSTTGAPGSFTYAAPTGSGRVGTPGFGHVGTGGTNDVGRTTLGVANGTGQDHGYLVALVEDTAKFNGKTGVDQLDSVSPALPGNTVLDGVYASADFGASWVKVIDAAELATPDTGTALVGANSASYAPGVQSWYNQWIEFDPTHLGADGKPDRVAFGLEEVWQTTVALTHVATTAGAAANTQVIGSYFAGGSCAGLSLGLPACPADPRTPAAHTTTHPDQHAGLFVPDATGGGVTLLAGNDGGAFAQHVASGASFSQAGWGEGLNDGLHTLQPYQVVAAKDGTAYMGLQDNGEGKILGRPQVTPQGTLPAGKQIAIYGGDGFYSATDPDNSQVVYEEYTNGAVAVSKDGGATWTAISPALTSALFATPFVMDPYDAGHLLIGGRDVKERLGGPTGTWTKVYDLGTHGSPGVAAATATATDPVNQTSAVDLQGKYAYVGFCGYCDVVTGGLPFGSGIATNVTPADDAAKGTSAGWHVARAIGLPQRYITGIHADPTNPATVYVTLGGYGRRWIPPGALGDDTSQVGSGHLFKSTDGGDTFVDISGNLPDVPANDVLPRGGQLLVATDLGVFQSPSTAGGTFTVLGGNLPQVSVFKLEPQPQAGTAPTRPTTTVLAATYGRGAYAFDFPDGSGVPTDVPEVPLALLLPAAGLVLLGSTLYRRRRLTGVAR